MNAAAQHAPITLHAPGHARSWYSMLSRLDLGADAACIHDPTAPKRPWADALLAAYRLAPGRLRVQFLPLLVDDLDAVLKALETGPLPRLEDPDGRLLRAGLAGALQRELNDMRTVWHRATGSLGTLQSAVGPGFLPALREARAELWSRVSEPPPPLQVWHVPALTGHGRAVSRGGQRIVATGLRTDIGQALCQVIHEECHTISDRAVLQRWRSREQGRGPTRDTARDTEGYRLHVELERAAVDLGQQVIDAVLPAFHTDYNRWRERFGVAP